MTDFEFDRVYVVEFEDLESGTLPGVIPWVARPYRVGVCARDAEHAIVQVHERIPGVRIVGVAVTASTVDAVALEIQKKRVAASRLHSIQSEVRPE